MSIRSVAKRVVPRRLHRLASSLVPKARKSAGLQYHSVDGYEKFVAGLIANHPIDEAMSLAVGGQYELIGDIASDVLLHAGARDGMSVLDFGCGSGRVASALARKIEVGRFLGTDVVQSLLDYATTKTPSHFVYQRQTSLSFPAEDSAFDLAYAFSVFTHLLQTECYIYLLDMNRVLKPGGTAVISFLELAAPLHWPIFETSATMMKDGMAAHLDTFTERSQFDVWADRSGFDVVEYIDGSKTAWQGRALGQSIAIFRKRAI